MPTLRPVAPAEVAPNGNVVPNPFALDAPSVQLVEPSAEAGAALLVALNDDVGIDEIEAAVAALRRALASEPANASVENASSGAPSGTSTREAETDAAPLALRIAELESELASMRAARDEANAALAVAQAALAQAEERAAGAEARAAQAEVCAAPASQPDAEPVAKESRVSEPPLDAQNERHNGMVKFGANATSGGIFGPPRLGEMLVRHGRITQEQLSEALVESRQTGGRLGRVLLQKGWIFEEELAQTLATQLQVPYVSLQRVGVDLSVVRLLPREIGLRFSVIPVRFKGDSVQVAFADPSDEEALEATGRYVPSIELAVAELSDIEALWRSLGERARGEAPLSSCRLSELGPAAET
jgi:MshEN domain